MSLPTRKERQLPSHTVYLPPNHSVCYMKNSTFDSIINSLPRLNVFSFYFKFSGKPKLNDAYRWAALSTDWFTVKNVKNALCLLAAPRSMASSNHLEH